MAYSEIIQESRERLEAMEDLIRKEGTIDVNTAYNILAIAGRMYNKMLELEKARDNHMRRKEELLQEIKRLNEEMKNMKEYGYIPSGRKKNG